MFAQRKHGLFLSVHVHDIEMAERKQNMALMWKKMMKNVEFEEPTSFLDHAYLGCTQRECESNEIINEEDKKCSNHESLLEQLRSYKGGRNLTQ